MFQVMLYWEAYADREKTIVMSTDPEATRDNFPRDMQWGPVILKFVANWLDSCALCFVCVKYIDLVPPVANPFGFASQSHIN